MIKNKRKFINQILILGLGNYLMGDDAIGIFAVEELQKKDWPGEVRILEVGTSVIYYLEEISHSLHIIAIDAVRAGGLPGSIYRLDLEDVSSGPESDAHTVSLPGLIKQARTITGLPRSVTIFGVEPENLSFGGPLTPAVRETLPKIIHEVTKKILQLICL